ncbi:MAG: hypothetical protein HY866_03215, partial [Chloroflexi bacterium]|nr:hypothetical protein [Chloroflexota bacterium]
MNVTKRMVAVILLMLLLTALPLTVWADQPPADLGQGAWQGVGTVTYDAPVEGAIDDVAFSQDWAFVSEGADRVKVWVERTGGNLVPSVQVIDNLGQVVVESYGPTNTYAAAEIRDYDLPLAAAYTIRVSRQDEESGVTSGAYRLSVIPLGVGAEHPTNATPVGPVQFETPVTGEITNLHWNQIYTLDAEAGDYVSITAQRTSGTLIPLLELRDANGQSLTWGYRQYLDDWAEISSYELGYTGQYQIHVRRDGEIDGDTVGGYSLAVNLLGAAPESARFAAVPPGVIEQYNTPVQGQITNALWYQDWQFRTLAADYVSVTMQRSPAYTLENHNVLKPLVIVLDSAGQELTRGYANYAGDTAVISQLDIPAAGTYTIRAMREGEQTGYSTGAYELTVTLLGTGEDSASLLESMGAVTVGTPATGQIDAVRWMQVWTYSGQEGEMITATLTRTDGTLVPYLEIRDNNGQSLYSAYTDYTYDIAVVEQFRLSYTGDYQIVVMRDSQQRGPTSGGYSLTVETVAP